MAKTKKTSRQQISGISGDLTYSRKSVWLWVKLPPAQYEFQDYDTKVGIARNLDYALANLLSSEEKALDLMLLGTSQPFDSEEWVRSVFHRAQKDRPEPYLKDFLINMHSYVDLYHFREKVVLLGIHIGNRAEYNASSTIIPLGPLTNYVSQFMSGEVDEHITDRELAFWNQRAQLFRSSLYGSRVRAQEVYAEEIAFAIRKNFFPAMPAPDIKALSVGHKDVWGEGEIEALLDAQIENNPRFLKITQECEDYENNTYTTHTGYRATLSFARFPESMTYPNAWIHTASLLPFTTDFYSRFTLEPARKVRREVSRQNRSAQDQARNQTNAGGNVSLDVQENLQKAEELDYFLSKSNEPWIFGRHRIAVEAETEEELRARVRAVIDLYKGLDIFVVWPTGDQMNLLLEGLPNDVVRLPSYYQHHQLGILSGGVPAGSGGVGDYVSRDSEGREQGWLGPYLGHTTGSTLEPVFYSVHSAIARNNPPACVITGSPGGGKSFAAFTLTYQMALQGIWTIYIDPKGDAIPMVNLPGLEHARLLDLKDGNAGILDPFSIGNNIATQKELAIETIGLMLGGRDQITSRQFSQLSRTVQFVASQPEPSLSKIVDILLQSTDADAEALGQTLNFIRDLPFAKLAFSAKREFTIRPDQGLTIITLLGLDLPPASTPPSNYNNANKLAVAIMYLLTSFTRQLMINLDKSHRKAIVIDEAWAVTSTAQGQKIVQEVARMGRSLNTGLVLVSQNAGDFSGEGVLNSVSTKMAFRAKTPEEIKEVLEFFSLENNEYNRDTVRNLNNGECLMQDAEGRTATVQVDAWNPRMREAFETNPEKRKNPAER